MLHTVINESFCDSIHLNFQVLDPRHSLNWNAYCDWSENANRHTGALFGNIEASPFSDILRHQYDNNKRPGIYERHTPKTSDRSYYIYTSCGCTSTREQRGFSRISRPTNTVKGQLGRDRNTSPFTYLVSRRCTYKITD
jgi:hypothetical protein